jgi:hypothetical protein
LVAKIVNILVYEIVSNRELTADADWQRLAPWLHVPLDRFVLAYLRARHPEFPARRGALKGLTKEGYRAMQDAARTLAARDYALPIIYESVWSAERERQSTKGKSGP